jgi:polysaccharide biosynthesis/export protein
MATSIRFSLALVFGISMAGYLHAAPLPLGLHDEVFKAGEALLLDAPMDTAGFLNAGYAIDKDGFTDLPILGKIEVGGHTREEVEAFLGEKLANYLRDTHIMAKPAYRITLLGHWMRPGQYYVSPNATLFEAVQPAGGIAGERTLDAIRVQRGDTNTSISFLNAYSQGISLEKSGIHSGDLVVIPVPRDNTGFWYWFQQSLSTTAQIATITSSIIVTYLLIDRGTR